MIRKPVPYIIEKIDERKRLLLEILLLIRADRVDERARANRTVRGRRQGLHDRNVATIHPSAHLASTFKARTAKGSALERRASEASAQPGAEG